LTVDISTLHSVFNRISYIGYVISRTGYLKHTVLIDSLAMLTVSEISQIDLIPVNVNNTLSQKPSNMKRSFWLLEYQGHPE